MGEAEWVILELVQKSRNYGSIIEDIVRIEKRTFPKHESLSRSFDEELRRKNSGLVYALIEGEVGGYAMYSFPSSLFASITKLAVKDNYRKQGLGEALLRAAMDKCRTRHVHRISLHVDPLRTPATSLYKKVGFQVDTLIPGYYSSDRDAYRMYIDFDTDTA